MIWRNVSSSSWQFVDLYPLCMGWAMSLQTFRTGSQLLTSFILTWQKECFNNIMQAWRNAKSMGFYRKSENRATRIFKTCSFQTSLEQLKTNASN
jgi:hypothetical protein